MSASATLHHEELFNRHLLGLVGGGFVAGIVTSVLQMVVGRPVEALGALSFAAVVGLVVNQLDPRSDTALVRLLLALMGGVVMGGVSAMSVAGAPWWAAAAGGGLLGAALTFDRPQSRARKLLTWGAFAAALPAAVFTTETLLASALFKPLNVLVVRETLSGTAWGLFLAVAAGASDLRFDKDALAGRLDEAISRYGEPLRDYLESARDLYRQVRRECERAEHDDTRQRAREIAGDTVESLLRFAGRFEELRDTLRSSGGERLKRRIERLDKRLAEVDDASVVRELQRARDEVYQQVQMRQRLELACARLESRLQRSVTTLEKLHLTLVQQAASAVNDVGLTEALARLEHLADEVEFKNLSIDELCDVDALGGVDAPTCAPKEACGGADGRDGALDETLAGHDASTPASECHVGQPRRPTSPEEQSETHHEPVVCEQDASC